MEKNLEKRANADLKQYLKARAVPHSGYTKDALALTVEKAFNNPQLTHITDDDDGIETTLRRTIELTGKCETFPDPHTLTSWDINLTTLRPVTSAKCLVYLLSKLGWTSEHAKAYKERGYQLFLDKHVTNVVLRHVQHQMTM